MKKLIYTVIILGFITIIILYFGGAFNLDRISQKQVDRQTKKLTDKVNGYSFYFPSDFTFKRLMYSAGWVSNESLGDSLFYYHSAGGGDLCDSLPRLVENPIPRKTETFTKEIINGNIVYKDIDLADFHPSFTATYALPHTSGCLVIGESNQTGRFDVLDSMLDSVTFGI